MLTPARPFLRKTWLIAAVVAIGACSSTFVPTPNTLDARLAWPCDRLVMEWVVDAQRLQSLIGKSLHVREVDGEGRLQFHIMQCDPGRPGAQGTQAIAYAYVLVPVTEESARVTLTRIPSDGWLALHNAAASSTTRPILEMFGFPILEATVEFAFDESDADASIAIALEFANGRIWVDARRQGDASMQEATSAYLRDEKGFVSVYFGEEKSTGFAASASVRLEGETLLSGFDLSREPTAVTFERRLVSDRIFWRLPMG